MHRRSPPAKQQGPGSQGQASPALRSGERRAGGENGLRCFPEPRHVGAVVGCPRRLSLCTIQLPEARFGPSVPRGLSAERPSWLRGHGWGLGAEGLRAPNPASPRRRTRGEWVSGTGDPSKAAGPREPGQPSPGSPYGVAWAGGEKGLRCFLDPRRVGAVVCCPRRVSLCRVQLPEARFGSPLRGDLSAERPSWLRGHGWAQGAEGLRAPSPACP